MQWKISLTLWFNHNGENSCRQKSHRMNFKSPFLENLLIKNQAITSIRNLILTSLIPKYLPTIESTNLFQYKLQYLIGLVLLICMDYRMWLTPQQLLIFVVWQSSSIHVWRSRSNLAQNLEAHKKLQQCLLSVYLVVFLCTPDDSC